MLFLKIDIVIDTGNTQLAEKTVADNICEVFCDSYCNRLWQN